MASYAANSTQGSVNGTETPRLGARSNVEDSRLRISLTVQVNHYRTKCLVSRKWDLPTFATASIDDLSLQRIISFRSIVGCMDDTKRVPAFRTLHKGNDHMLDWINNEVWLCHKYRG
jgi:hypothetical protein